MSIVFEKTEKYHRVSEEQREIVETYLLGKKFKSLHQALHQMHGDHTLEWHGLSVGEAKVHPRYLPYILYEATIDFRVSEGIVTGLVAKVEE